MLEYSLFLCRASGYHAATDDEVHKDVVGGRIRTPRNERGQRRAEQIARTALGSTVLLTVQDENGQTLRSGGFLVGDHQVASSLHVIDGASARHATLTGKETGYALGNVTAKDRERDLVVIAATGLPSLPIGDSDAVRARDRVYVAGNLRRSDGAFSHGIVSGIRY